MGALRGGLISTRYVRLPTISPYVNLVSSQQGVRRGGGHTLPRLVGEFDQNAWGIRQAWKT